MLFELEEHMTHQVSISLFVTTKKSDILYGTSVVAYEEHEKTFVRQGKHRHTITGPDPDSS